MDVAPVSSNFVEVFFFPYIYNFHSNCTTETKCFLNPINRHKSSKLENMTSSTKKDSYFV